MNRINNHIICEPYHANRKDHLLCLLCGWQVSAQELAVAESLSMDGKEGRYVDKAGNQALIYDGELEPLYLNRLEGHPYLDTREYRKGTLALICLSEYCETLNLRRWERTI